MQQFDASAPRRKRVKQLPHGGPKADFIARYSADVLLEKVLTDREPVPDHGKGLLLYERDGQLLSRLLEGPIEFDLVPADMIEQPATQLRKMLAPGQYSVVICNLAFDWVEAPEFLALLEYLLQPAGEFWFTSFGALTAARTRAVLAKMDKVPHFNEFYDLQEIGDALAGVGFAEVVLESSLLELEYSSLNVLLSDIERVYGLNLHPQRRHTMMPATVLKHFKREVETIIRNQGLYTEQVEILVAHGRKHASPKMQAGIPVRQA